MAKKMTKEEFIAKAEAKYGKGTYSYDEVDYQGNKIKVKIHCNSCGADFWKRPNDFLSGSDCYCKHEHLTPKDYGLEGFIKRVEDTFGPGLYSFENAKYVNLETPIDIKCLGCGKVTYRRPSAFIRSYGCECHTWEIYKQRFIENVEKVYGKGVFDFSEMEYKGIEKPVVIKDVKTGLTFTTIPNYFLEGHGNPIETESHGESLVRSILNELGLNFDKEYTVKNEIRGRNKMLVRIDFRIILDSGKEIWIEYNGEQHYRYLESFLTLGNRESPKEYFRKQLERDKNVREYCKDHDILLIEIPYTYNRYDKLKEILEEILINGKSPEDLIVSPKIDDICTN